MGDFTKLSDRIKQFIDYKNITVNKFSISVGASNSYFNKILRDNNSIGSDRIEKILRTYPEINPIWLMLGEGEMLQSKSKKNVVEENDHINDHVNDHNLNVKKMYTNEYTNFAPAVVTVDSDNNDNIALVPVPLCAGYLKGYDNPNFIAKLPTFRMPGLNHGIFRMFEVEGHSMFPTLPNKSYVVGQFVENWISGIRDNQIYAVISNEVEGGLVKRCINKIKKYNNLICKSDNRRDYPTQNISPESIKEIWEIKLHLNFQLPDPADIYDRMTDLEGEVSSLKEIIKRSKLL